MRVLRWGAYLISGALLLSGCVTRTINSDGTMQNDVIDKNRLSETYVDLAIEYQKHNAPQIALDRVNLAVSTAPKNARAYMVRAMIYAQLGKAEEADSDFKRALKLKDDFADAQVNYAVFLCNHERYPEAMLNFASAINNPLYFTPELAYYNRGNCYLNQHNYSAATADYLQTLTYRNPPADTYIMLAQIQFKLQNYQLARYYISKFDGSQTPATMWLYIQILQALLAQNNDKIREREYRAYQNALGQLLLQNYADSYEAQQYSAMLAHKQQVVPVVKSEPRPSHNSVKVSVAKAEAPSAPPFTRDKFGRRYLVIKPGDTLYSISRTYQISISSLEQINNLEGKGPRLGMRFYLDPK